MRDRVREEQWFNAQVMQESARWIEQNLDAKRLFLTVESFDPHEPWFVPEHYRRRYDDGNGREQVISPYAEMPERSTSLRAASQSTARITSSIRRPTIVLPTRKARRESRLKMPR